MSVVNVWVGRTTPTSARVIAKVDGTEARLAVDTDPELGSPTFFGPETPTAQDIVTLDATGLTANTQYFYAVEVDSTLDETFPGAFRTHPALDVAANFTFIAGNCAGQTGMGVGAVLAPGRISNHPTFDSIRTHPRDPLFFAHLGDLHYYDLGSGLHGISGSWSITNYRRGYDDVLLQPRQHELYRNRSTVYIWDDHDYGPNDSDGTHAGKANAQTAYRERVPHYGLPGTSGQIYQSFQVGRVLFIAADVRSERDPNSDPPGPSKTMLGTEQKSWMDTLLGSTSAVAVCWLMPSIWTRAGGGTTGDTWGSFTDEAQEVREIFGDNGYADKVFVIEGDRHAAGIARRGNTFSLGLPTYVGAALDSFTANDPTPHDPLNITTRFVRGNYGVYRMIDRGD